MEFFLIVASVCLAAITVALIPVLLQIRRSAKQAEMMMSNLDRDITPILKSLSNTAAEVEAVTETINRKSKKVDEIILNVRDASETILVTSKIFRKTLLPVITNVGGVTSGIKTFMHFLKRHH